MSFFSDKSPEDCWRYFDRHIGEIPLEVNQVPVRQYLLEREENSAYSTLGCYLGHIKAFGIYLDDRPWLEATRDDVIMHIKTARGKQGRKPINKESAGKPLGKYTKYQRMVMLREFYKWLLDTDDTPDQFRRMPFHKPSLEEQSQDRDDRLTQEEILDLLAATQDPMERCLVMFLADSGFRAGEVSALNIEDLEFDDYGAKAWHKTNRRGLKTGRRKVPTRLTVCVQFLREWIAVHPQRRHGERPVFISRSNRNQGDRLTSGGIWNIITQLAKQAKIRHVHPHMFRHTAASIRAGQGWSEEMMRLHFGWSKGSDMPSFYSHVEEDYDRFALRKAGVDIEKDERHEWRTECPHCGMQNMADAFFCNSCKRAIGI